MTSSKNKSAKAPVKPISPMFHRTKMCRFYLLGSCNRGESCLYAHAATDLQTPPDFTCTRLCERLIATGVCNVKGCKFAHNKEELRRRKQTGQEERVLHSSSDDHQPKEQHDIFAEEDQMPDLCKPCKQSSAVLVSLHNKAGVQDAELDDVVVPAGTWSRQTTLDNRSCKDDFSRQSTPESQWALSFPEVTESEDPDTATREAQPLGFATQRGEMQGFQYMVKNSFLHFGPVEPLPKSRSSSLPRAANRR
mmetsp:Transcript_35985/g.82641  ORF Transcript_35985/g.82641 Transcript_35985/m.82641 type:complete len:250 (-) Transcript_35985:170-919(-)